jgi:hypothetical protein
VNSGASVSENTPLSSFDENSFTFFWNAGKKSNAIRKISNEFFNNFIRAIRM